ncbi:hypothetical protein SEPL_360 [Salmonella phage SE_PL]|nr:hypothetical protein 7t3_0216 [Salmonella phage 7t3]QIG62973.1 hypothetical protein SEPL_360 [Salmonella phage SE_PL]WNV47169.1 hypothetical protein [Klebsiella phage fENko-Kae01]
MPNESVLTYNEIQECADYIEESLGLIKDTHNKILERSTEPMVLRVPAWDFDSEAILSFNYDTIDSWQGEYGRFHISLEQLQKTIIRFKWDFKPFHTHNVVIVTKDNLNTNMSLNTMHKDITFKRWLGGDVFCTYEMLDITKEETEGFLFQESLVQEPIIINTLMFMYEWHRRKGINMQLRFSTDPLKECKGILNIVKLAREMHGY